VNLWELAEREDPDWVKSIVYRLLSETLAKSEPTLHPLILVKVVGPWLPPTPSPFCVLHPRQIYYASKVCVPTAKSSVEPFPENYTASFLQRWLAPAITAATPPLYVSFTWTPGQIYWAGSQSGSLISTKFYAGADVPTPSAEKIHMNLWLYQANPSVVAGPTNNKAATVTLSNFAFTPYSG
jgi:hypothetical protein